MLEYYLGEQGYIFTPEVIDMEEITDKKITYYDEIDIVNKYIQDKLLNNKIEKLSYL